MGVRFDHTPSGVVVVPLFGFPHTVPLIESFYKGAGWRHERRAPISMKVCLLTEINIPSKVLAPFRRVFTNAERYPW